jgi:hypothetical protein
LRFAQPFRQFFVFGFGGEIEGEWRFSLGFDLFRVGVMGTHWLEVLWRFSGRQAEGERGRRAVSRIGGAAGQVRRRGRSSSASG